MFPPYSTNNNEDYYPIYRVLDARDQPALPVTRDSVHCQLYYRNSNESTLQQTGHLHSSSMNPHDDYHRYRQPGFERSDSNPYSLDSNYPPSLASIPHYSRYPNQLSYQPHYDSPSYLDQYSLLQSPRDPSLLDLTRTSIVNDNSLYSRQTPPESFSRWYPVRHKQSPSYVFDCPSSWHETSLSRSEEPLFSIPSPPISNRHWENGKGHSHLCFRSLMLVPLYRRLLSSSLSNELQSQLDYLCQGTSVREAADRVTHQCIDYKKQCRVNKSRMLFILFLLQHPQQTQTWLEFARMEMEAGCYDNALSVINTAINVIPNNLLLLTKKLRILEKLTDTKGICDLVQHIRHINSQRAVKVTVEAAQVLAKLGEERASWSLLCEVGSNPATYSGWLFLRILKYCQVTHPFEEMNKLVLDILTHSPKYGPLWLLGLDLIEHASIMCCPVPLPDYSSIDVLYNGITRLAYQVLPIDILWKVYQSRICHDTRLLNYLRSYVWSLNKPSEYNSRLQELQRQLFQDAAITLRICPPSIHWKVYLTLGREAVVTSYYHASCLIMQRGIRKCPLKYQHYLLLEYSKIEFFVGHTDRSAQLLATGILRFPDEWKLSLEYVNQLIRRNRMIEAYRLCRQSILHYIGAGRLWSSFIHLSHLLFGAEEALRCFRVALHHVAKSGEVWCEGVRIFLDPTSSHFSPSNALKALNYSAFFTPQYGDIIIEGLRLLMITSDVFLQFHDCGNPMILAHLLCSNPLLAPYSHRVSFVEPNYGSLWYYCMEFSLSSSTEVLIRAVNMNTYVIAHDADLYYHALVRCVDRHYSTSGSKTNGAFLHPSSCCSSMTSPRRRFPSALNYERERHFESPSRQFAERVKSMYGSIPVEN